MGAWIEIDFARQIANLPVPHPSWVRGLKLKLNWTTSSIPHAAPFMGAWIEITISIVINTLDALAAPFMGAWIEMFLSRQL